MRTFEIGYLLDRFKVGRDCDGPSALSSAEGLPTTQLDLPGLHKIRDILGNQSWRFKHSSAKVKIAAGLASPAKQTSKTKQPITKEGELTPIA